MACYVVLGPQAVRGIYDTWPACEVAVRGVRGVVYRRAADRALAERLLAGEGRRLKPGTYAFVDGNHMGGIAAVLVHRRADGSTETKEISTTVADMFPDLAGELARLRNPLAELVAVHAALSAVRKGTVLTVVHDYEGTGPLLNGHWKPHDPAMKIAVDRCRSLTADGHLTISFQYTNGHQSAAGGDEFAAYNARADRLASEAR
jgi:ribonuclease HI